MINNSFFFDRTLKLISEIDKETDMTHVDLSDKEITYGYISRNFQQKKNEIILECYTYEHQVFSFLSSQNDCKNDLFEKRIKRIRQTEVLATLGQESLLNQNFTFNRKNIIVHTGYNINYLYENGREYNKSNLNKINFTYYKKKVS